MLIQQLTLKLLMHQQMRRPPYHPTREEKTTTTTKAPSKPSPSQEKSADSKNYTNGFVTNCTLRWQSKLVQLQAINFFADVYANSNRTGTIGWMIMYQRVLQTLRHSVTAAKRKRKTKNPSATTNDDDDDDEDDTVGAAASPPATSTGTTTSATTNTYFYTYPTRRFQLDSSATCHAQEKKNRSSVRHTCCSNKWDFFFFAEHGREIFDNVSKPWTSKWRIILQD